MIGVIYVYIDTVIGFSELLLLFFFHCLVGCFSMIVWTPAVLSVIYVCVLYLHLFSAIEHVSHRKAL